MNFKKIITGMLLSVCFFSGIAMLFFGIKGTLNLNGAAKEYVETEGYLSGCTVYSEDEDGTTYRLVYTYTVGGNSYTVSTEYGTGVIPPEGTARTIKYDPTDPSKAVVSGGDKSSFLIAMGTMFTLVPLVMFLGILVVTGRLSIKKFDFIGFSMFAVLIIVSFGMIYIISGSFSIIKAFENVGLLAVIPFLLIAAGVFGIVKTLFFEKAEEK